MRRPPLDQQVTLLPVTDPDRAHGFYAGILGLDPVGEYGRCRYYRLAEASFVGLCPGAAMASPALTLVCDRTYDVDGWHDHLTRHGLHPDGPPRDDADLHVRHFHVDDPDGNRVEIRAFLNPGWPKAGR